MLDRIANQPFRALTAGLLAGLSLSLISCSDGTISTQNNAPEVLITSPAPGAVQSIYEPLALVGQATDSGAGAGDLTVTWQSSISGTLFEGPVDDEEGNTSHTIQEPEAGEHTITLRAVDPQGASGTYSVPITLTENVAPNCSITSPVESKKVFDSTEPLLLQAQVDDDRTPAEELTLLWSSSVDGELNSEPATSDGVASAEVNLTGAEHTISLTATDHEGLSCNDSVIITANGPPSSPGVEIQPQPPSLSEDLVAVIIQESVDPDGDSFGYIFRWFVDDVPEEGITGDTVPADRLSRGQVWRVEVSARDIMENLSEPGTATTVIPDTPPGAPEISLSPATPTQAQDLLCQVTTESEDPDTSDIITYAFSWERDAVATGLSGSVLDWSETTIGEVWTCVVTPNDGTLDGASASSSVTITEGCASIEGLGTAGSVIVQDHSDLRLSGTDFTVEAWVRPNSLDAASGSQAVVSKRGVGGQNGWYLGVDVDGKPFFQTSTGDDPQLIAEESIELDSWSHLALSFGQADGSANLYVNGSLAANGILPEPNASTAAELWIGNDSAGLSGHVWDGLVDDVRLSSVVRYTTSFIPSTAIGADSNTLAWWGFEEQSGTEAHDLSGNGHDGIVALMAFSTDSSCGINLPPTDPVISLSSTASSSEHPAVDSDITCSLDIGSLDPEGQTVTYSGVWLQDGVPTALTFSTFPATLYSTETGLGEQWSCQVSANDGVEDSGTITATTWVGSEPICSLEVAADTDATTNCSFEPPLDGLLVLTLANDDASKDGHFEVDLGTYYGVTHLFTGYRNSAYAGSVVVGWAEQEVAVNIDQSHGTLAFSIAYSTDGAQENTGTNSLSASFHYYSELDSAGSALVASISNGPNDASASETATVTVAAGESLLLYADSCGFGGGAHSLYLDDNATPGDDGAFRFNTGWMAMCDWNERYRRVSVDPGTYTLTLQHEDDYFDDNTGLRGTSVYLLSP